ncbi:MAG: restriction endonuclease subunit S [Xenococcaceae cyanobacterium MO_167.B52]|nr:restriction endonuclease subunit S [Xenococcaceae cyanobacterium MO_167.B52]
MELKPGYKQTEVGVIPEDWDVVVLGEIGKFKNGINKNKESFGFGFPFINLLDVFGKAKISNSSTLGLINSTKIERSEYNLKKGDVIFVRSSVKPEGVGLTSVVIENLENTVYSGFLIRFRENIDFDLGYKAYCFYEEKFRQRLIDSSTVSANTNINQDALKKLKLPLPPTIEEQKAIATALSDIDNLLGVLDRLIAKKQNLKQSAMQQLLTGKKRLPGFSREWEVCSIDELIAKNIIEKPLDGNHGNIHPTSQDYVDDGIPFIMANNVHDGIIDFKNCNFITREKADNLQKGFSFVGDILLTHKGTVGNTAIVSKIATDYIMLTPQVTYYRVKDKSKIINTYIKYYFDTNYFQTLLKDLSGGGTRAYIGITKQRKLPFILPTLPEQKAIASILSDMDTEIATLEKRRDKTHNIKQAMMQELLTGKTRLVEPGKE